MSLKRVFPVIVLALACAIVWLVTRDAAPRAAPVEEFELDSVVDTARETPHELSAIYAIDEQRAESSAADTPDSSSARRIEVHVVDENSKPFFGVEVELALLGEEEKPLGVLSGAMTAADGMCAFSWGQEPQADRVRDLELRFEEPDGYVDFDLRVPAERERVDVQLALGGHVFGSVRYSDGPLPEVRSILTAHWRIDAERFGVADTDVMRGRFNFERALAGAIERFELETAHTTPALLDYSTRGGLPVHASADSELELVFEPHASTFELTFLDAITRAPVEGMRAWQDLDASLESDANGRVRLTRFLAPRAAARVRFSDQTHRYAPARVHLVGPDPVRDVAREVPLEHALSLSGVVTDLRGLPQVGLVVRCEQGVRPTSAPGSTVSGMRRDTETDADARFAIHGLPPRGEFQLSFLRREDERGAERVIGFEVVSLPADATRELWILRDLVSIAGNLLDSDGQPVAGARINASANAVGAWRSDDTDAAGQFRIDDALPGVWSIAVDFGEQHAIGNRNIEVRQRTAHTLDVGSAGTTRANLRLPPSRTHWPTRAVRLSLIDARTRVALDDVELVHWSGIDHSLGLVIGNPQLADGGFVQRLPIGQSEAIVQTAGYATAHMRVDVVEGDGDGDGEQLVVLALEPLE